MDKKVIIVGAGLSGLACALELEKKGISSLVIEKTERVGGRVKTDRVDGFLLDHGFQVYLPSYELGQYFLDHDKLQLKAFAAGAHIYGEHKKDSISDPLREPSKIFKTLMASSSSLKDKWLTMKLVSSPSFDYKKISSQSSALTFLKDYGFSKNYINNFFKPFFSGVFLDSELQVSEDYFRYLFSKFSKAKASLPLKGMEALPQQMAASLKSSTILLNKEIESISETTLSLSSGESFDYTHLVMACPIEVSEKLGLVAPVHKSYNPVTTYYFKTRSQKFADKTLFLNARPQRTVNHVACLTAVNPNYAPDSWHLFSVNILDSHSEYNSEVDKDLSRLFGDDFNSWEFIKSYNIDKALPSQPLYGQRIKTLKDNIFLCGDMMESSSIQGALSSGYNQAQRISESK
ncbi:MAG: FAD-dependent oxidoreductase [Bdellovibrionales bacterium]|nr:FAD-dependent oxidoreductase [Bdellovibrionales bacterium]NQZ19904.1 FAD-dependent oxidoreductase [Bdellovibrionales bacterium]